MILRNETQVSDHRTTCCHNIQRLDMYLYRREDVKCHVNENPLPNVYYIIRLLYCTTLQKCRRHYGESV